MYPTPVCFSGCFSMVNGNSKLAGVNGHVNMYVWCPEMDWCLIYGVFLSHAQDY